jgi:O-antigen/teichoic acid export membrane protein
MESTFKPTVLLVAGRAAAYLVTFFIPMILVRVLSQAEFGAYKQLFLVYATVYGAGQLGMAESLFYFLPLAPHDGGKYALNAVILLSLSGLGCAAVLTASRFRISQWMSNTALADRVPFLSVYILLMLASAALEIVMISYGRHLWASASYGLSDAARAACFIIPVLLIPRVEWLLAGAAAFAGLRFCATLLYLHREFGDALRPSASLLRKQLAYALPFELYVLIDGLAGNLHQYVVSYSFDPAIFAVYSMGCLQIPIVDFVANPSGSVMMVKMAEGIRAARHGAVLHIWHVITRRLALLFFPLAGLSLAVARDLIAVLLPKTYSASAPVFMVWSTAILLAALQTDSVLRVYAQTGALLLFNIVRLLAAAGLIFPLLSSFGLPGAAAAAVAATAIAKALALARMRCLMGARIPELLPWGSLGGILIIAAISFAPARWIASHAGAPPLAKLIVTGVAYAATYGALLWRLGLLTALEKDAIKGWLQALPSGALKAAEMKRG